MSRLLLLTTLALISVSRVTAEDALDRFSAERLAAMHEAVEALKSQRVEIPRTGPLREYRANLHVHSLLSHDSRGKIEDIVAAAKSVGTQILMFTDHTAATYDSFDDGHQGLRDGVLLIPGAEAKGLLVFPRESFRKFESSPVQDFSDVVRSRGGLTFVSHLEERMDWQLAGITGNEIYNTHADFKEEKRLIAAMKNPLWLVTASGLIRKYPQEAYSALHDYPADYLKRWDQLCQLAPHTGVSANDAHQNIGLVIRKIEGDKVRVEDPLGEKLIELPAAAVQPLLATLPPPDGGDTSLLFKLQLDPYANALRHVATHVLMPELTQPALWDALEAGRAFVAFDWLADSTGFDAALFAGDTRHELGSRPAWSDGLRLTARAPLPGHWKLIRNGEQIAKGSGRTFEHAIAEPGVYRLELWLDVAGTERIWVLGNPWFVGNVKD